ncbi:hypothetical protein [Streptomyces sp. NPDC057552]|uniref:hypothetical protein n=1 Tax=Streptomyces sp. NPDC057552 TaxID=3350537 RepID=UPI00368F5E26
MNIAETAALVGAAGSVLGGGGFFVARATVRAAQTTRLANEATARANEAIARMTTEPQAKAQDLAVLQATVRRVDEENGQLRGRQARFDALLGGFSRTVNRLIYRMERAGIPAEPDDIDELVREYMRTGA